MAVSLSTATLMFFLCEAFAARRILDLGAGFSSVVARTYASAHPSVVCHSVDTSEEWLERTRGFLRESNLSTAGLFHWPAFRERGEPKYDLVLHDLGNMRVRSETLVDALRMVLPTGMVLIDDTHFPGYAAFVAETLERYCADTFPESEDLTRDGFGRCALLVSRVIGPLDQP
jgi:predicted O-methyltransferase YrrM